MDSEHKHEPEGNEVICQGGVSRKKRKKKKKKMMKQGDVDWKKRYKNYRRGGQDPSLTIRDGRTEYTKRRNRKGGKKMTDVCLARGPKFYWRAREGLKGLGGVRSGRR